MEEWRGVKGAPDYEVSSLGRVRSFKDFRITRSDFKILKPWIDRYASVNLCYEVSGPRRVAVHVLVCEAFHGPRPTSEHQVCHYDGNRVNNRADNLRWGTTKDNLEDGTRLGEARTYKEPQ